MSFAQLNLDSSSSMRIQLVLNESPRSSSQMDIRNLLNPAVETSSPTTTDTMDTSIPEESHIFTGPINQAGSSRDMGTMTFSPADDHDQDAHLHLEHRSRRRLEDARRGRRGRPRLYSGNHHREIYPRKMKLPPLIPHSSSSSSSSNSNSNSNNHSHSHSQHGNNSSSSRSNSNSISISNNNSDSNSDSNSNIALPYHGKPMHRTKKPHSNTRYEEEEVDFIRYMKDDCGYCWDKVLTAFQRQFHAQRAHKTQRDSNQCLSSRYYRDNRFPELDEDGEQRLSPDGRPLWIPAKVRSRTTPEGKIENLPYRLVDKHPERALRYPWVTEDFKEIAKMNLDRKKASTSGLG
ncbi:hypothetical protein B7494_g8269 [Chlorociboria aeruginascens]|nr:hypothetical protein B7494_g8269 [Chlorociboria aeruginascens]